MKKLFASFALLTAYASQTVASVISEVEPNSILITPLTQNVEASFTTGSIATSDPNVTFSTLTDWEWVSIESLDGDDTFDYYSFNAEAGQNFIFDLDFGEENTDDLDAQIALWSMDGFFSDELLHDQDDDCDEFGVAFCALPDIGSDFDTDPRFSWEFDADGTYVIGVAPYIATAMDFGFIGGSLLSGSDYTLQISRQNMNGGVTPVSEPGTIALFTLGLAALGLSRRRKTA